MQAFPAAGCAGKSGLAELEVDHVFARALHIEGALHHLHREEGPHLGRSTARSAAACDPVSPGAGAVSSEGTRVNRRFAAHPEDPACGWLRAPCENPDESCIFAASGRIPRCF